MKSTQTSGKSATAAAEKYDGFTDEERSAMKERARELKATGPRGSKAAKPDPEAEVLAKIAEMTDADRALAERVHAIVRATAPGLTPKTWYGMPAYAKDGKIVCFFQSAQKFKSRYATLGFSDQAALDDGTLWPTAFALTEPTAAAEAQIAELVRRAVG
ncbi:DUF1801 domain-containing protein [Kitasatospora herbaricolor]|uniref:DUF1801 domain-containing protein n=1 Tax=Kitasatospora herbaricolor TaxID=68217 RepID=A0ABZ1WAU7_9ACTN|nr:DUF1801 domain-containing protein [Kitasatospora herbaricolor]